MEKKFQKTYVCNLVCFLLMLCLVIAYIVPYWNIGGEGRNIFYQIFDPATYPEVGEYLKETVANYNYHQMFWPPALLFWGCVATEVVLIFTFRRRGGAISAIVLSVIGIVTYLMNPAMKLGSTWWLHLCICFGLLISAIFSLYYWRKEDIQSQ